MKKGFTLIELLVVIILIAAIVLLALPKITNSVKNYNTNVDKTTFNIIKEATKLYVNDNTNSFMKRSENTYCVSLNTLIEEEYLKNTIEYNNQDITNTKVMKVTYDNGFNYELVNKNNCERIVKFDTVCEADSEQLYAPNELDVGYKYNCKVDPDRARYNFYVLSYNDENGNIIFDKENAKSVNLIMDSNIRTGGEPVKEENPEDDGLIEWISSTAFGCGTDETGCVTTEKGPLSAMNYLESVTSKWTNLQFKLINEFNACDFDLNCEVNRMGKSYNTYARLPHVNELSSCDYDFKYNYLDGTGNQTNKVNDIYGYWLLDSYLESDYDAFEVETLGEYGTALYGATYPNAFGVRPVITLDL